MSALEAANARLMAQVAELSGDAHLQREAAPWIDATPEQRLRATWELCELAVDLRAFWPPGAPELDPDPDPLPEDTRALLAALRAESSR